MSSQKSIKINFFQKNGKFDIQSINASVYMVELLKDDVSPALPLYIGESVYMIKRCGEHLYDLFEDAEYFGLTDENLTDQNLQLDFKVLEHLPDGVTKQERKEKEKGYIEKHRPLTQSPNSDKQFGQKVSIVQNAMEKLWKN